MKNIKNGTIILAVSIALSVIIIIIINHRHTPSEQVWRVDSTAVRMFEDSLEDLKSHYEHQYRQDTVYHQQKLQLPKLNIHDFDPNTADSIELLEQGFKPWQVKNMLKYRAKGGKWRKKEDMLKIYGVDSTFYAEIEPFIVINDSLLSNGNAPSDSLAFDSTRQYTPKRDTIIEINSADTTTLQFVKYIGPKIAQLIISYRDQLGGFCSVEQVAETPYLPEGTFEKIKSSLTVDPSLVRQLNVNKCSVSQLSRHPYIRAEQAKAIYQLRRKHIKIADINQLYKADIFTDEQWQQILPYLSLE